MSDAVSTTRANPDGSITVTLAADIPGENWMAVVGEMRAAYPGRYMHWTMDDEGHDVFEVAAPAEVAPQPCGLCAAGQPHGHGHGTGGWV